MADGQQYRLDCSGCTYSTAWESWVKQFAVNCAINHEMLGDEHLVTIHHRTFDGKCHHVAPSRTLVELYDQEAKHG